MPNNRVLVIALQLLSFASPVFSQDSDDRIRQEDLRNMLDGKDHPPQCQTYEQVQIPAADLPTEQDRTALSSCNSENLYFGFDRSPEFEAARKCAYLERDAGKSAPETVFGGAGLLTMIYANGKGASRDFDLALRFVCESGWAPAENYGRFNHLLKLKGEHWTGDNFNLCDDATSGFMEGWCAHLQERLDQEARTRKLSAIIEHWSPAEKNALRNLKQASNAFFQASSSNEVDLSGSGRAAFEIEADASLNDGFVAALENFERGELPSFSLAQFRRADADLNSTYSTIQSKRLDLSALGTVSPEGIRIAQRAWIRYRKAWVRFGRVKYPQVTSDSWRAWLTLERSEMLHAFVR